MDTQEFNLEILLTLNQLKELSNLDIYEFLNKPYKFSTIPHPSDFIHSNFSNKFNIPFLIIQEANNKAKIIRGRCKELNIDMVGFNENRYPTELINLLERKIEVPTVLFYKGQINKLNINKKIAIIGTRNPTYDSLTYAFKLAEALSSNDYYVISGLAIGCDTQAHLGGLSGNLRLTAAILAGGLNSIYPTENQKLANEIIIQGGALITESPPEEPIFKWSFTKRNRIQSALSDAVIVIETQLKGGTMVTANYAHKQKKPIFVLGGKVLNDNIKFSGNKKLISKGGIELSGIIENDISLIINKTSQFYSRNNLKAFSFDESKYLSLSIKEIKQICKEIGVDYNTRFSKKKLIAKIRSHFETIDIFSE